MARGRKLENLEDFKRALKGQYGIGTGKDYKPWLRVQSVNSKGHALSVPKNNFVVHGVVTRLAFLTSLG